jgi:hypothetical protein
MRSCISISSVVICFSLIGVFTPIFSSDVKADDCVQFNLPQEVIALKDLAEDLQFNPASDLQISNAFCARKEPFGDAEMNDWLLKNQGEPNVNLKINGISFENESYENLEAFRNLTTYLGLQGQVNFEKQKNFNSSCKKVDCALKEIFSPEISVQLLFMQRRFGMNGSHIVRKPEEAVKWKREELDTVILGLSDMPEGLLPISKNHPLFRSSSKNSGGAIANATVTIFDLWNDQTKPLKRATIVHELGHYISSETRISQSDMFKQLSGWSIKTENVDGVRMSKITCDHPEKVVSIYGKENYDEDFAESVFAYRYNPKLLKDTSPEKYDLIKSTVFDGVEYISEASCKNPKRISENFKAEVEKGLKTLSPTPYEIKEIASRCGKNIINQLFAEEKVEIRSSYLDSCYNESLDQYFASMAETKLASLPYPKHIGPMVKNIRPDIDPKKRQDIISKAKEENNSLMKKIFKDILSSESACKPSNQESTSKKLQLALYGRDRNRFNTELKSIVEKACRSKDSQGIEETIKNMIK